MGFLHKNRLDIEELGRWCKKQCRILFRHVEFSFVNCIFNGVIDREMSSFATKQINCWSRKAGWIKFSLYSVAR